VSGFVLMCAICFVPLVATGCARRLGDDGSGVSAAREFNGYPLYWLGERFERWDLERVDIRSNGFSTFIYGDCTPQGEDEPSCAPPLQLQVQPLCAHLTEVARAPIWQTRRIRGAPVGTIDSAPVLFTRSVQIKVYRGQGSDAGLPIRALRALRSMNGVPPLIGPHDRIPAPPAGVLAGTRPCPNR
jgi:hypothetical protein